MRADLLVSDKTPPNRVSSATQFNETPGREVWLNINGVSTRAFCAWYESLGTNRREERRVEKSVAAEKTTEIVIRADGNAEIGAGHLMRCLTIADEIRKRERVVFWCADESGAAQVRARGYKALTFQTDYRRMAQEIPLLDKAAGGGRKVFLVDSYYVDAGYLQALGAYGSVYLLEDVPGHTWPVDGVINYNAYVKEEDYRGIYGREPSPRLYIGAAYVPLRRQFSERTGAVSQAGSVEKILLTTGGGDSGNIAGRILEKLEDMGCEIHVVSGPYNPNGEWLDRYAAAHPRVKLHRQVTEMAGLMRGCDLAVTAGGTTVYELCALGVPFVCFSCAENQEALTAYVGQREIGWDAGQFHHDPEGTLDRIGSLVRRAVVQPEMRRLMSAKARALVDGQGAERLAKVLEAAADGEQ